MSFVDGQNVANVPALTGAIGQRTRTMNTGHAARWARRSATLPSALTPRKPREPTISSDRL
jgi:hypothetical protein